jgi:hypothetical protein
MAETITPYWMLPPEPERVPRWFMGGNDEYEEWQAAQEARRFVTELESVRFEQGAGAT